MELRQLEAFTAVMAAGSITGAARQLNRSQSMITRQIQDLEAELGYDLLHRNGPRIKPTLLASHLYEEAERIISSVRRIQQQVREGRAHEQPLLISSISSLALGLMPQALARFQPELATRKVHLRTMTPERVVNEVLHRTTTIGLCSLPVDHYGVQVHWIAEAPCVAVLRADDPLAARQVVRMADLADRPLVGMDNPHRLQHRLNEALHGRLPEIATTTSANAQVLVRAGLGVAILEPLTVLGAPLQGLVHRPLDLHLPFYFGALTPQGADLPPLVTGLLDTMREIAGGLPGCVLHAPDQHARLVQAQAS